MQNVCLDVESVTNVADFSFILNFRSSSIMPSVL